MKPTNVEMGIRIRNLRKKAGLTAHQLAERVGFKNVSGVYKWEKGIAHPGPKIKILAETLGISIDGLLGEKKNSGSMAADMPALKIESTAKEEQVMDKILFESLLSLNHRLDTIDRRLLQIDSISQRISSVEQELADIRNHGARPLRSTPLRKKTS